MWASGSGRSPERGLAARSRYRSGVGHALHQRPRPRALVRIDLRELWLLGEAAVGSTLAAWVELAAGRHLAEVRRQALDRDEPFLADLVHPGHRAQKRPRVRMLRVLEDRARRALFDDPARVHDDDAVAQARHQRHVVRDQDDRRAQLSAEVAQQLDDRRLHGYVEGGGRLVGDQQGWLVGDAHRVHGALPHAARELVWVVAYTVFSRRAAYAFMPL